jgi:hypothetical protein
MKTVTVTEYRIRHVIGPDGKQIVRKPMPGELYMSSLHPTVLICVSRSDGDKAAAYPIVTITTESVEVEVPAPPAPEWIADAADDAIRAIGWDLDNHCAARTIFIAAIEKRWRKAAEKERRHETETNL